MINNRQGGRRRGRGGSGGGGSGGTGRAPNAPNHGSNRQDNRQRGNAAQLLEKYRQLARDAQLSGDRVQTETYLQYAEHYFRVLNENRSRFEEQRRPRDEDYDDDGEEEGMAADEADGDDTAQQDDGDRRPRPRRDFDYREQRADGDRDQPRNDQSRNGEARNADVRAVDGRAVEGRNGEQPSRGRRPRREANGDTIPYVADAGADGRIALDSLPPAIAAAPSIADAGDDSEEPRPRRRTRRPLAEDGGEPTPAAA